MALRNGSASAVTETYDVKVEQKRTLDFLSQYNFNYVPIQTDTKRIDVFAEEDGFGGHNASGYDGNVAIATDKIIALDLDKNYPKIKTLLGKYSETFEVRRSNANTRGSLFYIISDFQPVSLTLIPDDEQHPVMELKGLTKRHTPDKKLITGSYKKGVYVSNDVPVLSITLDELNEDVIKPICEYYGEHPLQALDARFVDASSYKQYSSGNKHYDLVRDNFKCSDIADMLRYEFSHHSGDWYKIEHSEHDTIFFNEYAFKHHAANISGGVLDFYVYLTSNCNKLFNEDNPLQRQQVASELLKSKGIQVEEIATRELMGDNDLEEISDYLLKLYSNDINAYNTELTVISKTLGIPLYILNSVDDIETLSKRKKITDRKIEADIRRSNVMYDISNQSAQGPFMEFSLEDVESYMPDYVVDGHIAVGDVAMIIGDGNIGKSFFALHLGLGLSCGEELFGGNFKASHEKNVVYLCGEGKGQLRKRLAGMIKQRGLNTLPDNFSVYNRYVNIYSGEGVFEMQTTLLENEAIPDLVIIDNLRTLSGGANENHAQDVGKVFDTLTMMSELFGCAILFIHHTNKGDEYSGSTMIKTRPDAMWQLGLVQVDQGIYGVNYLVELKTIKVRDGKGTPPLHYYIDDNSVGPYVKEVRYGGMSPLEELAKGSNKTLSVLARNTSVYLRPEVIAELGKIDLDEVNIQLKKNVHMVAAKADDEKNDTYALSKDWLDTKATSY